MSDKQNLNQPDGDERLSAMLNDAFPAGDPSAELEQRVAGLASRQEARVRPRPARLRFARVSFALALILMVGGTLAYRFLFNRPGESATQLIPGSALLVVTLDTTPSPAQVPLFQRIDRALKAEGLEHKVHESIEAVSDAIGDHVTAEPASKELMPLLATSFAFAMLNPVGDGDLQKARPVIFLALKDVQKGRDVLARGGRAGRIGGLDYYHFAHAKPGAGSKHEEMFATVIGPYVVLAQDPGIFQLVEQTHAGVIRPVSELHAYQEARAALPEDANLMVFVSPTALAKLDETTKQLGVRPLRNTPWLAFSGTLRDQGIVFDYRMPIEYSHGRNVRSLEAAAAIDMDAYRRLPANPYCLIGMTDPARYWTLVEDAVSGEPKGKQEFENGIAEFEKETGLSVSRDILPGLKGRLWLAVYPDREGPESFMDGLIVIEDANGADPAALAAKVRGYLEEKSSSKDSPIRFVQSGRPGGTEWRLDSDTQRKLSKDFGFGLPFGGRGNLRLNDWAESKDAGHGDGIPRPGGIDLRMEGKRDPVNHKTVVHAQIGKSILIASSQPMLDRAIAAYNGQGLTMADDHAFMNVKETLPPGHQGVFLLKLSAIMERLRPDIEKGMKDAHISADDVIRLFGGLDTALITGARYDGRTETGALFLPLDYERAIRLISAGTREAQGKLHSAL